MAPRPKMSESLGYRQQVWALVKPHRRQLAIITLFTVLSGALEALFLVVVTRTALSIADGRNFTGLVMGIESSITAALIIAPVLLVARLATALVGVSASTRLGVQVGRNLRRELADSYLRASWQIQQNEPSGRLLQVVTGFVNDAVSIVKSFSSVLSTLMNLLALLAVAIGVDPVASLVIIAALLILGVVLAPIRLRIRLRSRSLGRTQLEFGRSIGELSQLGLEMQTFGVRGQFKRRIEDLSEKLSDSQSKANILNAALPHMYTFLAFGAVVMGLAVANSVGVGELSAIGAVMLTMLRSLGYGQSLQTAMGGLFSSLPFLEELEESISRFRANAATSGSTVLTDVGDIEARNVYFSYTEDRPALFDVSFRIKQGEIIGIIGHSGSGKSTLVQLLLGLREPTQGEISVGGVNLRDVDRRAWTKLVAFVPQDPRLFTGTIAENVTFFRDRIDEATADWAIDISNLRPDLARLPEGIDTHIGERGVALSGGQRQRVSIARALAGRPQLIILDEPTSALDVDSEAMIRETLERMSGEATVVVVAHRLSTLDICHRIMVIEGGRLDAFDTPKNLQADNAYYRHALEVSGII